MSGKKDNGRYAVGLTVNGARRDVVVQAGETLLDLLRRHLRLTGTKCGCEVGECGACTVVLDGKAVNSCMVLAVQADSCNVTTIEGLADADGLHPLQEAFLEVGAVQCGFCTPGMLMSAWAVLQENPGPTRAEVTRAIAGNLCRCTGYQMVVDAIMQAAKKPD
ncbi:MAG: (2Fe-2S)-binding protein [Deltaproteobacteria bacterium]|nr:(2Fe-2S)-binding protein [Deltaproteobacteria bacterium]